MKSREVFRVCLVIFLAIIAFTPIPAASMTVEFWGGWTGADGDAVREIVRDWNAKNPNVQMKLLAASREVSTGTFRIP